MKQTRNIAVLAAFAAIGSVYFFSSEGPETRLDREAQPEEVLEGRSNYRDQAPQLAEFAGGDDPNPTDQLKLPPLVDANGVISSWGELVEFRWVGDCYETFAMTTKGEALPTTKCENKRLETDHPYGSYTIDQLRQASMSGDAIATYILAIRFSKEPEHGRQEDATYFFVEAFKQKRHPEIFRAFLADLNVAGVTYKNGSLLIDEFEAAYVFNKAGYEMGVIDEANFAIFERARADAVGVDFELLERRVAQTIEIMGGE